MRMSSMHHRAHDSVVVVPAAAGSSPVGLLLRSGVAITPTRAFSSATAVLTPGVYCNGIKHQWRQLQRDLHAPHLHPHVAATNTPGRFPSRPGAGRRGQVKVSGARQWRTAATLPGFDRGRGVAIRIERRQRHVHVPPPGAGHGRLAGSGAVVERTGRFLGIVEAVTRRGRRSTEPAAELGHVRAVAAHDSGYDPDGCRARRDDPAVQVTARVRSQGRCPHRKRVWTGVCRWPHGYRQADCRYHDPNPRRHALHLCPPSTLSCPSPCDLAMTWRDESKGGANGGRPNAKRDKASILRLKGAAMAGRAKPPWQSSAPPGLGVQRIVGRWRLVAPSYSNWPS